MFQAHKPMIRNTRC